MKTLKKISAVVISVILWLIILLAALFAFTTLATKDSRQVKSLFGITPMTVQSDSMKPTFSAGDLIFVKKCDTSKLAAGDIITFHTLIEGRFVLNTHRIDRIESVGDIRTFTTKGDNNEIADPHIISDGDIVGQYLFKIKGFGKVMDFLSSSVGFLVIIVLPLLLFFIYQIYHLVMVSINLKKAMALEEAEQKAEGMADELEAAKKAKAEAEAELEEARRMKAEAEALKREAEEAKNK